MRDIFLSYAIKDREKAVELAIIFNKQHWSLWDTYRPVPGADSDAGILKGLDSARVVIVLWSSAARESAVVGVALKRLGQVLLVPVLVEKVELPFEFSVLRTFDLSDWNGAASHTELQRLVRHLRALIATPLTPTEPYVSDSEFKRLLAKFVRPQMERIDAAAEKKRAVSPAEGSARFMGVFISYRRNEAAAYARGLYDRLAAHFGREKVFFDHVNVGWGEDFVEAITAAAESCAVMIALISRQWARGEDAGADDYVRLEVAAALGRGIRVIPILIQGATMPAPKELPEDLAPLVRRNALALSDARWERDVEDLIKTLEGLLKG